MDKRDNYKNIPSLREHVLTRRDKNIRELEDVGLKWTKVAAENRLSYEIDWLGVPVIQTPEDLILMQELIFKIQPDVIIETGIAHGGSLIYYASLMELLDKGKVMGIDIEIREHNKRVIEAHPLFKRIELIEGSSVSGGILQEVREKVPKNSKVIVCLDSNHTKTHVLKELQLYQEFVPLGGYIVVFDTNTSRLAELGVCDKKYVNNSPKEAVDEFLKINDGFEIDEGYNKLYVSYSPNGYLRRIK
ncbi:MAG: CmcI family methyltransferase [Candidatus Altiarchaeota archaeon]|nr:CmcI family methyltransferase [Candidatus Altiarchaeota archaeon]